KLISMSPYLYSRPCLKSFVNRLQKRAIGVPQKNVFAFLNGNSLPAKLLENLKRNFRYPTHAPSASIRKDKSSKYRKILPPSKLQHYRSKSIYLRGQNHIWLHYRKEFRDQKRYYYSALG
ncbi:MAG: hypothetical protein ACYSWZ_24515, partial [Planctomycetota bacterium]